MEGDSTKPIAQQPGQPAQSGQPRQGVTVRNVDRPECQEIFADSVSSLYFDGQTLRLEMSVTRVDEVKPNTPVTARRYPTCRLVLSPAAALELINRTQQIVAALKQANTAQAKATEAQNKNLDPLRDNDASIM